jgi:hypothetical protein
MNRASNANSSGGNNPFSILIRILLFITACIGLYYLYNWLYNSKSAKQTVDILSGTPPDMTKANATTKAVATTEISSLGGTSGLNYTTTFWVYVSDTKGFNVPNTGTSQLAHLMDISDPSGNSTLVFIGLNPKNGNLVVRQSTGDSSDPAVQITSLVENYNVGTTYTSDNRCDIVNGIEFQRWILIGIVANNKTLDVYIDGKLARSCVYKGNFKLTSETGKLTARFGYNNNGNLKGFFSKGYFYNYPVSPDLLWASYQEGPGAPFTITSFFSSIFGTDNLFGLTPKGEALQKCIDEANKV